MTELALVMPMAGHGSRFHGAGVTVPKPLIEIGGRPLFWWAVESVRRRTPLRELVFVVLTAHVEAHGIDHAIRRFYPHASIVALEAPTAGAAETASTGIAALAADGPIAINDCDHAFATDRLNALRAALDAGAAGALVGFASDCPAYSFARLEPANATRVLGTVEKQCVSPYAIAGCYLFRDKATFELAFAHFRKACPYPELFVSGLYNVLCERGERILFQPLDAHVSFGTAAEAACVSPDLLAGLIGAAAT